MTSLHAAAPVTSRGRATLLRDPLVVAGLGLGAATLLRLRDPHTSGSYGFCPFLLVTGFPCPGCGGLRAVHDLLRGDLAAAAGSNAVAVAVVLAAAVGWVVWTVRRARGRDVRMVVLGPAASVVVLGAFLLFGVLRVTPWGAALAP